MTSVLFSSHPGKRLLAKSQVRQKENSRLFYATNSICVTVTSKSDKIFLFVTLINNNSIPFQIKF